MAPIPATPTTADAIVSPCFTRADRRANASAPISRTATNRNTFFARLPRSSWSCTACRAPGTRSTGPCASVPDCTASSAAVVPASSSTAAAGPVKAARPVSEIQRNRTPTARSTIAKWTICGWYEAMLGMGTKYTGRRAWGVGRVRAHPTPHVQRPSLLGSSRVPDDIVHGPLHELDALVDAPLRLGPCLGQTPLDILHLEGTQLVLDVEVAADQRLELRPKRGALCVVGAAICPLRLPRIRLEPEHLRHELGADAVASHQVLDHVELHGQLRDFDPVLVERTRLQGVEAAGPFGTVGRDEHQEGTRRRFGLARPLLRDLLHLHLHRLRVGVLRRGPRGDRGPENERENEREGELRDAHMSAPVPVE